MSRISSQGSLIQIQSTAAPTSSTIASATKAAPCAITVTATPPAVGSMVVPRNTGWASIEGMPFRVSTVAGMVVTLEDSDTSKEVAAIATVGPPVSKLETYAFVELCRSNFTANQPAGATIDVTTLCDDAHRLVPGLPALGTWSAAGFYDCADVALAAARSYYRAGSKVIIDVVLADGCGFSFMGTVNTMDITLGVNAAVTNSLGGNIDGGIHFYKTPPAGFVISQVAPAPEGEAMVERERVAA